MPLYGYRSSYSSSFARRFSASGGGCPGRPGDMMGGMLGALPEMQAMPSMDGMDPSATGMFNVSSSGSDRGVAS